MDICEALNAILQQQKMNFTLNEGNYPSESHSEESGSRIQSRILEIDRAERARDAELIRTIQKRCELQRTNSNAVRERLGLSIEHKPKPQPPASPRSKPESSLRGRRIRTILEDNSDQTKQNKQTLEEEGRFFERKLRLGSQMAVLSCLVTKMTATDRSPSPDTDNLSSVDTHTPSELRAMSQIGPFTPTPPPTSVTRRPSRLPVMSVKLGGAVKEIAGGCKLQTYKGKVKELLEKLENCQLFHRPSPQPLAAPKKTMTMTPKVPAPSTAASPPNRVGPRRGTQVVTPKVAAPPSTAASRKRGGPRHGTQVVTPKVAAPPSTAALPKSGGPRRGTKLQTSMVVVSHEDLKPLDNPKESLSLCFKQLSSDDWEKKIDGLKSVDALAQHHPTMLPTKLHEVCVAVTEEVNNLRSAVACAAINTVAQLHVQLGRAMDPEAERTGRTLLLKLAQTTDAFIHQQANSALDALVEGCSPARVIGALLNTGLSHRCIAVKESTAKHLHQLERIIREERILTAGKTFAERFLNAVGIMAVDAAPEVRIHGQEMLQGLARQRGFTALCNKVIPEKNWHSLQKILKKMRQ